MGQQRGACPVAQYVRRPAAQGDLGSGRVWPTPQSARSGAHGGSGSGRPRQGSPACWRVGEPRPAPSAAQPGPLRSASAAGPGPEVGDPPEQRGATPRLLPSAGGSACPMPRNGQRRVRDAPVFGVGSDARSLNVPVVGMQLGGVEETRELQVERTQAGSSQPRRSSVDSGRANPGASDSPLTRHNIFSSTQLHKVQRQQYLHLL